MSGNVASGVLLVIIGIWVMLQTLAGDLPGRILSLGEGGLANKSDGSGGGGGFSLNGGDGGGGGGGTASGYETDTQVNSLQGVWT